MTTRLSILFLALFFAFTVKGQVKGNELRQQVLEKDLIDSLFIFGKWTESGQTETHLKYLGTVTTKDRRVFKIMNSCWFWGLARHATSRILIFNDKNQYLGNYKLGMTYDLPDKLENGELIFTNMDNEECDKELITKVDFANGLPKEFFIKCKGKFGDIYSFSNDE